jgi:hypothetical protein
MIKEGIEHIESGNIDEGIDILSKKLSNNSISLIISKTRLKNRNEALSIFYDSLLIFIDQVKSKKFKYLDDSRSISYLNTICLNKAREYCKIVNSGFIIDNSILAENKRDFIETYDEIRNEEVQSRKNEGYEISTELLNEEFPLEVINAFHSLKEKCKFLIILKYKLKLKHDQIVEALAPFFQIKNKEVSKAELQRCMSFLKSMVDINLDGSKN